MKNKEPINKKLKHSDKLKKESNNLKTMTYTPDVTFSHVPNVGIKKIKKN